MWMLIPSKIPAYDSQSGTSSHFKSVDVAIRSIPRHISSIMNGSIAEKNILEIIRVFILKQRMYAIAKGGS